MQGVQGACNLRNGVLVGLKEIKEGILKVDHRLGVIIDTLEGTEGENFGGWLVKFLGSYVSGEGCGSKSGAGSRSGQEEGSSSGNSSSSSSSSSLSSSSSSEDEG